MIKEGVVRSCAILASHEGRGGDLWHQELVQALEKVTAHVSVAIDANGLGPSARP